MIKQDNRPQTNTFEQRIELLKNLLNQDPSMQEEESKPTAETEPSPAEKDKAVFISVNGDNNIISAGKSQYVSLTKKKKNALFGWVAFCMLFF